MISCGSDRPYFVVSIKTGVQSRTHFLYLPVSCDPQFNENNATTKEGMPEIARAEIKIPNGAQ